MIDFFLCAAIGVAIGLSCVVVLLALELRVIEPRIEGAQSEWHLIWFWEQPRYLNEGWCIYKTGFRGSHYSFWAFAFFDLIRPTASRSKA